MIYRILFIINICSTVSQTNKLNFSATPPYDSMHDVGFIMQELELYF